MINNSNPAIDPTISSAINAGSIGSHGTIPHAIPILNDPLQGYHNLNPILNGGRQIAVHPIGTPVLHTPVIVGQSGPIVPSRPISEPIRRVPIPVNGHIVTY